VWGCSLVSRLGVIAVVVLAVLAVLPNASAAVSVTYTVTSGSPGDGGWYVSDVAVAVQTPGATDTTCPTVKTFRASTDTLDCTATDGLATFTFHLQFKIDKDKPTVTGATADHQPNGNGWYNTPVTVTLAGSDATSGIASCQQLAYNGPDSATAGVSGTCRDVAGNVSAPFSFALKYDATAPSVSASPGRGADAGGWYNHPVAASASGTDSGSGIDGCSAGSYDGPATDNASLSGTCKDSAGNSASASITFKYDATPPDVSQVVASPGNASVTPHWTIAADSSVTVIRTADKKGASPRTVYHGSGETFTDTK